MEDDVAAIADESFSPVFLRNATAFGFSPRLRADIVLNNLVGHAVLTGDVRVLSDGTPWRPLVHARDIATAFLVALEAPIDKVHCAAYNVGTESNNLTVAEIAQSVVDVVPGAKLLITGETGSDPRSYRVDFSAFRRRTGLRSRVVDSRWRRRALQGIHLGRADRTTTSPRSSPGCRIWKHLRSRGCSRRVDATDQDRCVSSSAQLPALASRGGDHRDRQRPIDRKIWVVVRDGQVLGRDRADDRSDSTRRRSRSAPGSRAGSRAERRDAESRCRRAEMPAACRRLASPFECRPARRARHRWRSGPASPRRAPSVRACRG